MFAAIQTEFARALLDADEPAPPALTSHTAQRPQKRFAVYRNNVVVSLVNALRNRFPATERIVGDEFFAAMARVFVTAHPPRSKILSEFGDDFPGFIAQFEPAAELPWLPDVARLEAARTRAYHAADAAPLSPDALAAIDPERIGELRIALHPSLQIVRSRFPVVTVWAMNAGEAELGAVDFDDAQDALILRPHFDVSVRQLPQGGATFLLALAEGKTLAEAAGAALDDVPTFDLTANLAGLIASGAIAGVTFSQAKKDAEQ
jgi:hypothetical protein